VSMRKTLLASLLFGLTAAPVALAQDVSCTGPSGALCVPVVLFTSSGAIAAGNPLPVTSAATAPAAGTAGAGYPPGATAISGNATGSTGAVVGTLAANATKFTYIGGSMFRPLAAPRP